MIDKSHPDYLRQRIAELEAACEAKNAALRKVEERASAIWNNHTNLEAFRWIADTARAAILSPATAPHPDRREPTPENELRRKMMHYRAECEQISNKVALFLSGRAPCDRGYIFMRGDVDELASAISKVPLDALGKEQANG